MILVVRYIKLFDYSTITSIKLFCHFCFPSANQFKSIVSDWISSDLFCPCHTTI